MNPSNLIDWIGGNSGIFISIWIWIPFCGYSCMVLIMDLIRIDNRGV